MHVLTHSYICHMHRWDEVLTPFLQGSPDGLDDAAAAAAAAGPSTQRQKKNKKKNKAPPVSHALPWKTTPQGTRDTEAVLRNMVTGGAAPPGVAESNMRYCLTHPSYLKTHEWFVIAGPIGRLALLNRVDKQQYQAICRFFDVCCKLWQKELSVAGDRNLTKLRYEVAAAVALLETVIPGWEMDIMFHLILHLVDRMRLLGPCWSFSMFSFERTWGQLDKWRTQQRHMEACIMNAFRAYRTATLAMEHTETSSGGSGGSDSDDDSLSGQRQRDLSADRAYDAVLDMPTQTARVLLPFYAHGGDEMHVLLSDEGKTLHFVPSHTSVHAEWWRVELHRYYYNQEHNTYGKVFDMFMTAKHRRIANIGQLPFDKVLELLPQFTDWGDDESGLSESEHSCTRPYATDLRDFERLELNGTKFTCIAKDERKKSKSHVVATVAGGRPYFGRLRQLVRHIMPMYTTFKGRHTPQHVEELAVVDWFEDADDAIPGELHVHPEMACPVVAKSTAVWNSGCLWACRNLKAANLILAPHPDNDDEWLLLHPSVDLTQLR
jgi:hypothetical protein